MRHSDRLEAGGILDETLVIFMTDHGISHVRAKQFLYDEGTHVPFIVCGPGIPRGQVREDLVEHIDMPAISLAAAGLPIPPAVQGRDVFAKGYVAREAVFTARDRCDETVDRIRSVRTPDWLYIRNVHPGRPMLQPNAYKDAKPTLISLRALHDAGRLDPATERLLFAPTRPSEELYRWREDRWQLENLAADRGSEPDAMYESDMKVYVGEGKPEVEATIATMKRWAAQGKGSRPSEGAMLRSGVVGLVLTIAAAVTFCPCEAQQVVVQQPAFQQFAAPTTVLVPDRGEAFLGGTRGGFRARDVQGPIPLGSARAGGAGASSVSTRVFVHDFRAMDEALLRGSEADRPGPGLTRAPPKPAAEPVVQAPRGGWLRRMPPRR